MSKVSASLSKQDDDMASERGPGFIARFGPRQVPIELGPLVKQHMIAIASVHAKDHLRETYISLLDC